MNKPKVMGRDYIFRGIMPQRSQRTFFSNVYDDSDGLPKYGVPLRSRKESMVCGCSAPKNGPGRLLYRIKFTLKEQDHQMEHSG